MATLRQYFDTDRHPVMSLHQSFKYGSAEKEVEVIGRIHLDFDSNTTYISYYVPAITDILPLCQALIQDLNWATAMAKSNRVQAGLPGEEALDSSELQFSGRIFIYSETDLSQQDLQLLKEQAKQLNRAIQFRGPKFAQERSRLEKPLAFICHDSRDKDVIARQLAMSLRQMLCPVWYDEFSLKLGESLRQSIETGLKECKRCILVVSPNFLSNTGWTKVEFNSIFTREILERSNLVLPIWHDVTAREVYEYSPSLADRKAVQWSDGLEEVSRQVYRAIIS